MPLRFALRECLNNGRRLFNVRIYRQKEFQNLSSDVKLNCIGGGIIFFGGDALAQAIEKDFLKQKFISYETSLNNINYRRSIAMGAQGVLLNGALLTPFYRLLDVLFGDSQKLKKFWPSIPLKICAMQIILMPISTAIFIFCTPVLHCLLKTGATVGVNQKEKRDNYDKYNFSNALKDGYEQINKSFVPLYITSWKVWPILDTLNMWYVPVRYRPLWDSFIDIFWTAYLSFSCHSSSNNN